ncbi:MAG: type III PLP-dependent enzyme [Rhodospirillales bacterium]|nr:type III PLP-dependent enzyme [Rhodospirillales bacterium]
MDRFNSARSLVRALAPTRSVTCLRPAAAARASRYFVRNFPGQILYAVKTNPMPEILDAVHHAGVRHFDVASITEIDQITRRFPDARVSYMHPVKSRDDIAQAYFQYGLRDFALDSGEELEKILSATGNADDLSLLIRLAVPNFHAELDLSAKFGIKPVAGAELLFKSRSLAKRLGVCFHVGSQCMSPSAYTTAINMVRDLIVSSGVTLDIIDVGGGFPSAYPNMEPPPLNAYMGAIATALNTLPVSDACEVWAEPGRALVAEAASTLVRVDLRRDGFLYINDGTYGSLFDAGVPGFIFPARAIRNRGRACSASGRLAAFSFYGPTCDSLDFMKGPFMLPDDIGEGDYIEIGLTGAYGSALRTHFNGFHSDEMALLSDAPMLSMYRPRDSTDWASTNWPGADGPLQQSTGIS